MSAPLNLTRVLVGVDFDDSSALAVRAAGTLASVLGATLTLVHAHTLEMPVYFTESQIGRLEIERTRRRAVCEADVRAFARQHTSVAVDAIVEEGSPADAILRLAPRFDLVVVGTKRLHGPRRWWLGSVAETVLRESPVPVLIVPMPERTSS
jgi:nucleotide-binding universal stress UspA family protein